MTPFANQVVLITGAASGIGRQMARVLAGQGAAIAAVDLHADRLAALIGELPGDRNAWAVADVTDRAALHAAVGQLSERLGPVDLLIAAAGIGMETSALAYNAADFERIIRVNLIGVSNSIEAVLPRMLTRQHGHLVAISSLASFRGLPGMAGYCASKAGVNALLDSLRVELAPRGIAVTTICPGWIRTPMTAQVNIPMPDILEVEDAVETMLRAIRRRRPFLAFPRPLAFRVGLLRWLPARLSDWLIRRLVKRVQKKTS